MFRFVSRFFKRRGFVGSDLAGNSFFEHPTPFGESSLRRTQRVVQYAARGTDMWDAVTSQKRLAVQWQAWLSHTRIEPPTIEELQQDQVRQERLRANIAILKARDAELRAIQAAEDAVTIQEPIAREEPSVEATHSEPEPAPEPVTARPQEQPSQLPDAPILETETWAPRPGRRRGPPPAS